MKKWIALLLVLVMALSMVACTATPTTPSAQSEVPKEEAPAAAPEESAEAPAEAPAEDAAPEESEPKKIFFINVWRALDFFVNIEASVKRAAEEMGFEITCVDANLDYVKTADYVSQAVIQGYDVIMIDGDASLIPAAEEAMAAGVTVINYDTWIGTENITALVASNNQDMGRLDGEYAVELLKEKYDGEVKGVVYYINFPVSSMQERVSGFVSVMEQYPDVELVEIVPSEEVIEVVQKLVENVLIANPEGTIDMIFGANSTTSMGAIAAVTSANRTDLMVLGIDDEEGQMTELQTEGSCYYATVAQDPIAIGQLCVEAAAKALNGEEVEDISVPAVLVTKDNVAEYLATNAADKEALAPYK